VPQRCLQQEPSFQSGTDWSFVLQAAICSVSLEALQILLDAAPAHLTQSLAQTSLHQLCAHVDARLRFSSRSYVHSQCSWMWPLLAHAVKRGACANKVLSSDDYKVCKPAGSNECTPLGLLALRGCAAGIEVLVASHQAEVNLNFGASQHTALHLACSVADKAVAQQVAAVVEKLVSLGADLHAVTADGDTALHVAVERGSVAAVQALSRLLTAERGDSSEHINLLAHQNSDGYTPVHTAINNSDADCCEELLAVLLSFKAEHVQLALSKVNKQGRTVLHTAIEQHKLTLVQQLLVASSKLGCATVLVNTADSDGADCWCIARRHGTAALSELLATYTATAATTSSSGSSSAVTHAGDAALASSSASHGDLDCANVHTAVRKAHSGCLKLLLARSPSAAAVANSSSQYPLHLVDHSKQHCDQLTAALLSACPSDELHSSINTADASGQTALQRTVRLQCADEPEGISSVMSATSA
jgi:ankyrin repeat protein